MKGTILGFIFFLMVSSSLFAQQCQCVQYVKNRYNIVGGVGSNGGAKDYGSILINSNNSFTNPSTPQNKDIIVMQPGFGNGTDATYGHIALVGTVTNNSNGTTTLVIYGANQGKLSSWSEWGCSNVSAWI